jgi:multicomponent Na+:H+ antiporter subunit D
MKELILTWVGLPFFVGFSLYLIPFPALSRPLALVTSLLSGLFAGWLLSLPQPEQLQLLDHFGVTLQLDALAGYFILTNALITAAVLLYCWPSERSTFFWAQVLILHGSLNAAFACVDFISLYVALEVIGIAAFLLIIYPRHNRSIWVGLSYLFVSNTAMLFYLIGAVLAYKANLTFRFDSLVGAPPEASALILLGLLVKGGIFVSGLWLPQTHAESETPVSALMSGVVVKAGVLPLLHCALMVPSLDPIIRILGMATTLLGVGYAIFEKDTKRMLAFSTISQLGFMLVNPLAGGFYALMHGLAKATMFLGAGNLSSRSFKVLQGEPMATRLWFPLAAGSLAISGAPLLAGFGAKALSVKALPSWQGAVMSVAAVGTAISFAKFLFLPHQAKRQEQAKPGFWPAALVLIVGLVAANGFYLEAYKFSEIGKALGILAVGWLLYWAVIRRVSWKLPRQLEGFEHLIGVMSVSLVALFWMVLANLSWVNLI